MKALTVITRLRPPDPGQIGIQGSYKPINHYPMNTARKACAEIMMSLAE